jgi:hypothetical protein
MRASRTHQPLTYDVRLPNETQADALRLLEASRSVVNQTLSILWPSLDDFGVRTTGPAWKQVGQHTGSPDDRGEAVSWGRWLWCDACGFNGDRDYCASLNIARPGMTYLLQLKHTGKARACLISDPQVKPVSYTGAGSALLLPPTGTNPARHVRGKICYAPGWLGSAFLQSSQSRAVFLRLYG